MPRAGELVVRLRKAKGIKGDEAFGLGKADVFANLLLGGDRRSSKVIIDGGSDPEWNEEFTFKIAAYVNLKLFEFLKVFIYDQDFTGDSRRGTARVDVKSLLEEHEDEVPDKEYPVMYHGEQRGLLVLGFTFKPANTLPVVQPELTTVPGNDEESAFEHLMHKFTHLGHDYRKPNKNTTSSSGHAKSSHSKDSEKEEEEKSENEDEEGWSSESESDCESEQENEE